MCIYKKEKIIKSATTPTIKLAKIKIQIQISVEKVKRNIKNLNAPLNYGGNISSRLKWTNVNETELNLWGKTILSCQIEQ